MTTTAPVVIETTFPEPTKIPIDPDKWKVTDPVEVPVCVPVRRSNG